MSFSSFLFFFLVYLFYLFCFCFVVLCSNLLVVCLHTKEKRKEDRAQKESKNSFTLKKDVLKGFSECLVFINGEECSVIVNPGSLKEESAITIKDIVAGQSGIALDKLKIVEAK